MKKSIISASPFIMLIIPVILFLGLSLAISEEKSKAEFVSNGSVKASSLLNVGEVSIVKYLLK